MANETKWNASILNIVDSDMFMAKFPETRIYVKLGTDFFSFLSEPLHIMREMNDGSTIQ